MLIRELKQDEYEAAAEIQLSCFGEETSNRTTAPLTCAEIARGWEEWKSSERENADSRVFVGAFDGENLVGVAIASFAEPTDVAERGIELNGLWIKPPYRGKGLSRTLINTLLKEFDRFGIKKLVVYNYQDSTSNSFYRHLGFGVLRTEIQSMNGLDFPVDVFVIDTGNLK